MRLLASFVCCSYVALGQIAPQPCPALPASNYELASPFIALALTGGGGSTSENPFYFGIDKGIQLVDLNGDSLPDILWGFEDQTTAAPHPVWNCVYLNTGCAWVYQSNFTGRDAACAAAGDVDVRGVSFSFKGLTVKQFTAELSEFFGLPKAEIQVRSGQKLLGPTHHMEDVAASREGLRVVLGKNEVFQYVRSRV